MKGDFIGFTFDGISSEELGIQRVSDGSRYNDILHPEANDRTSEVPGRDGTYYFGTDYGAKPISVSFAYDDLTENQFRKIRQVFNPKKQGRLIFSESPYKVYLAKVESPVELEFVCFDEEDYTWEKQAIPDTNPVEYYKGVTGEDLEYKNYTGKTRRTYKGEGTVEFICYYPFAKSAFKTLPAPTVVENVDEWAAASRLLTSIEYENFDKYDEETGTVILYNAGDMPTGLRIYYPFENGDETTLTVFYKQGLTKILGTFKLTDFSKQADDTGLIINTENQLVQGVTGFSIDEDGNASYTTTGTLYNKFFTGSFFKIEPSYETDIVNAPFLEIVGGNEDIKVFYDYLYL